MNRFRTKIKRLGKGSDKISSDPSIGLKPSVVNSGSSSPGFLALQGSREMKRAVSVGSSPDVASPSPSHQVRKVSLSTDSPIHNFMKTTPTSPLVNAKLPRFSSSTPQESIDGGGGGGVGGVGGGASNGHLSVSRSSTPGLPRVSVVSEDQCLDRQGIIDITVNVHSFLAAISKLKKAMEDFDGGDVGDQDGEVAVSTPGSPTSDGGVADTSDLIVPHVTHLIQVVQTCLNDHNSMQSTGIKDAAKHLTNTYSNCDHTNPSTCTTCNTSIDSLIDAFTDSVSEYLTGESAQEPSYAKETSNPPKKGLERAMLKGFSKSQDNLSSKFTSYIDLSQQFSEPILDDIDQALFGIESGIDVAARYIKMRMKYQREIVSYLSKRAQIESRYNHQMTNLGNKTLRTLQEMGEEHPIPLVNVFMQSVEEDMRNASNSYTTYNQQVGTKLVEPFEHKISDCEKRKKELNTTWRSEKKKLIEAKTTMKSAMSKYKFLGEDLARVKNLPNLPYGKQADKRKKEVTDLELKWQEAEVAYKNAVAECNDCQYQVHVAAQRSILCAYRRMAIDFDIQLQSCLETYFILQQNFFTSLPEPMVKYLDDVREYNIGSEFMGYLQHRPKQQEEPEDYLFEEFDPEADSLLDNESYVEDPVPRRFPKSTSSDSAFLHADESTDRVPSPQPFLDSASQHSGLTVQDGVTGSPHSHRRPHSDYVEGGAPEDIQKSISRRNSDQTKFATTPPTTTPLPQQPIAQGDIPFSRMALTHTFRKLRGPARCRECDTYVYFHGHECETCGLACHKKCLETLAIRCGDKRLARKMNTFGVDFHKHLKATKRYIPIIVTKCIEEIDERALDTRGLYRISSAKTKLEHLCQLFESGADRVDLSDRPSHLIGSCLKLYFRQLPEPLLTFAFYHDFVTFARECSYILPCNLEAVSEEKKQTALEMLERLKGLLQKLPYENYITLAKLLYHLNKVSHPDHVKHNFMPPSNLGIVFGPNMLRQREQVASLALLADMTAQAKAIEIMISHVHELFHMTEENVKEAEHEYDDTNSYTKEVNVDEPVESIKSPQLDLDDVTTAGSRTPYNTPPERRRENVYELGEVLEVLQSVGRRSSESLLKPPHPRLGEVRDHLVSTSLPNFSPSSSSSSLPMFPISVGQDTTSTLSTLSNYLRSSSNNPLEKMLTPVEERPAEVEDERSPPYSDDDDDDAGHAHIIPLSCRKIDGDSRPTSSLSNQEGIWMDSEVGRPKDVVSILSGGDVGRRGDRLKEDDIRILGERGCDLNSGRPKISQSSDEDSNSTNQTPPLILGKTASTSTEDTSAQEGVPLADSPPGGHNEVFADHASSHSIQKHNSLHESLSGSPRSSPLSSTSHTTQSSYSELPGEEATAFSELQRRKISLSAKYAKYEAYRSTSVAIDNPPPVMVVEEEEPAAVFSQGSTQDTTDKAGDGEEGVVDGDWREPPTSTAGVSTELPPKEGHVHQGKAEGISPHLLDKKLLDTLKHCDSGIDETPDANKTFKDGVRRFSATPSEDSGIVGPLPLSRALLASRESGLADSPDPETFIDDVMPRSRLLGGNNNNNTTTAREEVPSQQREGSISAHSTTEASTRGGEEEEVGDINDGDDRGDDEDDDICDDVDSMKFSSSYSFERSVHSAPRSLDSNSFSRYARRPIRVDSKLLRTADLPMPTGAGLRYRSASMDNFHSSSFSDSARSDHSANEPACSRAYSMSTSKSAVLAPLHTSPVRQATSKNAHPNQRFCVNPELSPTSPSPYSPTLSSTSPSQSPSKVRRSKGIRDKLKPALRVFKIAPSSSSSVSASPVLHHLQEADELELASTPGSSVTSSPKDAISSGGSSRRMRMMSPEAVVTHMAFQVSGTMRRTQSSEDILESSGVSNEGEEVEEGGVEGTTIGSLVVIPEPKKHKGKFFGKLKGKKGGSRDNSPLLTRGAHSGSTDGIVLSPAFSLSEGGEPKSPKSKKRHRTPHFV